MALNLRRGFKKRLKKVYKLYRNFLTSWKVQTKVFFEHSTLHGVRYIAENGRPFMEKFMWFACVTIGTIATSIIIVSLWDKFQTNPTITGLDTDFHNWKVPFPAIILCPEIIFNKKYGEEFIKTNKIPYNDDILYQLSRFTYDSLKDFRYEIKKIRDNTTLELKSIAFNIINRCEDIFDNCEYIGTEISCCDHFFPIFTEVGICYAFNSRHYEKQVPWNSNKFPEFSMRYIKETDPKWAFHFSVKNTSVVIPIYILNPDEQPGLDMQPQHVWNFEVNKISFSVKQTYTTDDTRQLSIKQRHCVFQDEVKLTTDNIYTYTACTRQCRMDNAMKYCKCVPHFYPQIQHYKHCNLQQLHCIWENLEQVKNVDHCACHLGCSNTVYEVEKLTEVNNDEINTMEARFVSWPMVRYKREVLFGWVDLLVSFGGIAGLFLGFSLLSGVEILYYLTIRACCMVFREKREIERIEYEEDTKLPEDYDLSFIPYCCSDPLPGNGLNEVARAYYKDNLNNYKIAPMPNKWNPSEKILPPFGIEFIN